MACDPSSGQCWLNQVWTGSLPDFANQAQTLNAQFFQTGDFGQLTIDFSGAGGIPQIVADALTAAISTVSGFLNTVITTTQIVVNFVSTSPTVPAFVPIITGFLIAVGFVLIAVRIFLGHWEPTPPASLGWICQIGSQLGFDCGTATLLVYGIGGLAAYAFLFGTPASRRQRR